MLSNDCVNDLININRNCKFLIYADDIGILFQKIAAIRQYFFANEILALLRERARSNSLKVVSKTKAVFCRPKNKTSQIIRYTTFDTAEIKVVKSFKTWSVTFN